MIRTTRRSALALALAFTATLSLPAVAQEPTAEQKAMWEAYAKAGTPGEVHAKLKAMEGDYDIVTKSWEGPGEPRVSKGTVSRKMILGDRVLAEHMSSEMNGQPYAGHGMSGYDNTTGKHWTTWNDNMSTGLMVAHGDCDAAGACTFAGSWVDPVTKKDVTSRMTTRWTDANTEVFEMYAPGPDGKEAKMMEITYTRKAK